MTKQKKYKSCTKDEFYEFIKNYPGKLSSHVCCIGEPSLLELYDSTKKEEVAWCFHDDYLAEEKDCFLVESVPGYFRKECNWHILNPDYVEVEN